jgi:integrase/recombinase XerC
VLSRLQAMVDGCGWVMLTHLDAARAEDWIAQQRTPPVPFVTLPDQPTFTSSEVAALLGISKQAVCDAVRRHRLPTTGVRRWRRLPGATVQALIDRREPGNSPQTRNYYRAHLKSFGRWLAGERTAANPFARLKPEPTSTDRRHDRRELDADELRRLLDTARGSTWHFRGLTGPDRFRLYATACGTGFRAAALASLTPESFDLDGEPPVVTLAARRNKSRKLKVQPLPPDVAELLRG